ncbi:hypothetical protein CO652_17150 [Rhizobium sp. H4]|nr:hypothetical protein CO652_17150 [Rhizobium sp. H4]
MGSEKEDGLGQIRDVFGRYSAQPFPWLANSVQLAPTWFDFAGWHPWRQRLGWLPPLTPHSVMLGLEPSIHTASTSSRDMDPRLKAEEDREWG